MSYNKTLQSNNTDLQAILNTINALPEAGGEQAIPEISVDTKGLVIATAGSKSSTYQLAFQAAKTITPSTVSQVAVSSGYYTGGDITVAAVPTQAKSITPTIVTQNVTPDSGKFLSKVTVAGDSNLVAGNIKSGVSIFGVSGTAQVGGGTGVDDASRAIINRTITEISDDKLQIIGSYAFYSCSKLTIASFPACTSISGSAFYSCSQLTTASFPMCTTIGIAAFYSCTKLTTASFPACTWMGQAAFRACHNLTTASFPACRSIASSTFSECHNLSTISFPVCTKIGSNAFYFCSKLTTASFPACTWISASAFRYCRTLSTLQLGASSVCTLANSNAFTSTPFAGYSSYFSGTPHIYVPSSLITTYQSATNWTYFSSYFSSIESLESNLITFTIDGSEYQAEEGMIWEEWVESGYNIGGFYSAAGFILKNLARAIEPEVGMAQMVVDSDGTPVNFGDTIKLNHAYQTIISQY